MKTPPPSPDLSADDFSVFDLTPAELQATDAPMGKWHCCVEGCNGFTRVKNFDVLPKVWWRKRWIDLSRMVWYCGRHWKLFRTHIKMNQSYEPMEGYKIGPGINHTKF